MSNIDVVMLGKFDIIADGQSILSYIGNSSKSLMLLKYLILNSGKPVTVSTLVDVFWSEAEKSTNPENALKTMVSRIRSSLLKASPVFKNCIISEKKSYMWNPDIPCNVDVATFEDLCDQVEAQEELTDEVREQYISILNIYSGDLSYNTAEEEEWVVSRSMYLHHRYLQNVYRFIDLLEESGDNEMIIQVCRIALDIDTFDEKLNLELMQALKDSGQNNAALMQYRHVTSAYYKYLGIEPSEAILSFYKSLIKADLSAETDIQTILSDLVKKEDIDNGAFICDYSIFRDIYQLQLRNLERQENKMFLALLTVESTVEDRIEPLILDAIMRRLMEILKECLRKGDTISRYSSSQYAILLPMMTYSNGYIVINRVKKMFYKTYTDNTTRLIFQFGSIDQANPTVL
ncbi:winged helix-turn-helix domain-containing protein [Ruminococcaceae bacterium OttesenSCG-928-L11]|nr:winged helix-turn-helix domain-containing protein [Ruminococcaceae bacterium OttesenSCG-928-L11]